MAQATASLVTYPHEVLRSHMHVEGSGSLRSMLHTLREALFLSFHALCHPFSETVNMHGCLMASLAHV